MKQSKENAPFQEPWEAQALATAMGLQEAGVISPTEWSEALGAAIRRARAEGGPEEGDTYYHHVVDALETVLSAKGLIGRDELRDRKRAWEDAYRTTPHGKPVHLNR